jgi:hypothetical protein
MTMTWLLSGVLLLLFAQIFSFLLCAKF